MVHGGHGGGVAPAEHLRDDPVHAALELPGPPAHAVVHEADGTALPCGAPEDLAERADEARMGVRDETLFFFHSIHETVHRGHIEKIIRGITALLGRVPLSDTGEVYQHDCRTIKHQ